jgi:hypothetical protein
MHHVSRGPSIILVMQQNANIVMFNYIFLLEIYISMFRLRICFDKLLW